WGCVVCDLPPDGATAVLCSPCFDLYRRDPTILKLACRGYPVSEGRIPIAELSSDMFEHDRVAHLRDEMGGFDARTNCREQRMFEKAVSEMDLAEVEEEKRYWAKKIADFPSAPSPCQRAWRQGYWLCERTAAVLKNRLQGTDRNPEESAP